MNRDWTSLTRTASAQILRRRKVLQGVGFSVSPGTLVGIVGENGAGKSTLLRILAGELRPSQGEVFRRGSPGYCPQQGF